MSFRHDWQLIPVSAFGGILLGMFSGFFISDMITKLFLVGLLGLSGVGFGILCIITSFGWEE